MKSLNYEGFLGEINTSTYSKFLGNFLIVA